MDLFPLFLELTREEEVESGSNRGDCGELSDLVEAWRHGRPQKIRRQLKLETEGKKATEAKTDGGEPTRISVPQGRDAKANETEHGARKDDERSGGLDQPNQEPDGIA
jgi:hypothetical protein